MKRQSQYKLILACHDWHSVAALTMLQACHAAAVDASAQAEHARTAAEAAATAVHSCRKSVGDAAVSAEAQGLANKAGNSVVLKVVSA